MSAIGETASECTIPRCVGGRSSVSPIQGYCDRHARDPSAPPMKVACECPTPDIERLRMFGANAAQCRKCGSPIEGTI